MEKGFIFSLIFAAIVAIFALNNGDKVLIDFIFTKVEISQAIIIFASAILGAVVVALLGWVKNLKFKKEIKDLNKKLNSIEEERNKLTIMIGEKEDEIRELKNNKMTDSNNEEIDNIN